MRCLFWPLPARPASVKESAFRLPVPFRRHGTFQRSLRVPLVEGELVAVKPVKAGAAILLRVFRLLRRPGAAAAHPLAVWLQEEQRVAVNVVRADGKGRG